MKAESQRIVARVYSPAYNTPSAESRLQSISGPELRVMMSRVYGGAYSDGRSVARRRFPAWILA